VSSVDQVVIHVVVVYVACRMHHQLIECDFSSFRMHLRLEEKTGKNKGTGDNNIMNNMNMNSLDSMTGGGGSGMGMNNNMSGGNTNGGSNNNNNIAFGLSVNPNQHYEMLKLHHMNLLNEIQETTLMMNLYQQQQLQQQGGGNNNMSRMGFGVSQVFILSLSSVRFCSSSISCPSR